MDKSELERIQKTITHFIENQEEIGTKARGSGHLSDISVNIDKVEVEEVEATNYSFKVTIEYTKSLATEFTYLPDNPPIEDTYSQILYLTKDIEITGFTKKHFERSNQEFGELPLKLDDTQGDSEE